MSVIVGDRRRRTGTLALLLLLLAACAPRSAPPEPVSAGLEDPASRRWPSFRGSFAAGVSDGHDLPGSWSAPEGRSLRWKTPIPGLAHSSPVVWDGVVYVTSAVSSREDATFKHGLYGSGDASEDRSPHRWTLTALSLADGEVLWERTAHQGVPVDKRHIKATYANSTPATDGRRVVALFGSEGLFAWTVDGAPLWRVELGRLDAGAYDAPDYEWGSASSPILWRDRVYVQCDTQREDFLVALDAGSGHELWRTGRDEPPSWGTPTLVEHAGGAELVTNGSNAIRGYDPLTGEVLWTLGGSSRITAPTPVHGDGLIFVGSGRRPEKPIFAIRPGARGDITPADGETTSEYVAWSSRGDGPYMPTPLLYRGVLYSLNNNGVLDAYDPATGERFYRQRIEHAGGGFSASPVAADGKIYLASEDGDVFVVEAGREYRDAGRHAIGERMMATPAIADGTILFRGERHLFAIGGGRR